MCTAAVYHGRDIYMGRTLDYEFSYGEEVVLTPRGFPLPLRHGGGTPAHYALLGTAHMEDGYPLYYDAVNEKGLGMAGLSFPRSARYAPYREGRQSVAPFELLPLVLGRCAAVDEARALLREVRVTDTPFSDRLPAARLHWLLADAGGSAIAVEPTAEGLRVYDAPARVLTNEPPFPMQMLLLDHYMALSPKPPENRFSPVLPLAAYSRGMGALGLPGDLSSPSRFTRAAFTALHALRAADGDADVGQMFHILGSVEQVAGCCELADGSHERTIYTACWNAARGIYYYTTYTNRRITAVDMHREDLDGTALRRWPMRQAEDIRWENASGGTA